MTETLPAGQADPLLAAASGLPAESICPTTGGWMHSERREVRLGEPLSPKDVADVAIGHATVGVELGAVAATLARARAVIDQTLASGVPAYGLNRGLGPLRDSEIPAALMADFQRFVILSHAAAIGRPLSRIESRAVLLTRLNTLAAGASGASPALFAGLLRLLQADVVPVIPDQGSVGAADLSQRAAIGQVLLGAGRAWLPGEERIVPGAEALAAAGLVPLQLAAKDALALIGSNALSVATASLAHRRATLVLERADLVAGLTIEALRANLSPFGERVLAARPHPGQQQTGRRIREVLAGGDLAAGRRGATSLQDPISLRTIPQVHGAVLDQLDDLDRVLSVELNCAPDNPFLDLDEGVFVSNGNFSITGIAVAFDGLRIGLAHVAGLAERRVAQLVSRLRQGVPLAEQVQAATAASGYVTPVILAQTASALVAQIKHAATPISLTGTTVGDGVEDHSSMAYPSVRVTETVLDHLEQLFAVEALLAATVISVHSGSRPYRLGAPVERLRDAIADVTRRTQATAEVVDWVVEALRRDRRGDDLAEMRPPAAPPPVSWFDREVSRHDQLH